MARLWRRLTLAALRPELDGFAEHYERQTRAHTEIEEHRGHLALELAAIHAARTEAAARLSELTAALTGEGEARADLRRHLETRLDQAIAEVADLRAAFLEVRSEFERIRDERLDALQAALERIDATRAAAEAGLQAGIETLQAELASLRDGRVPAAERSLASVSAAVERVQAELEDLRTSRLAHAEADVERIQDAVTVLQREVESLRDERVPGTEAGVDGLQRGVTVLQGEIEALRDRRLPGAEAGLERLQDGVDALQREVEGVRDSRIPAIEAGLGRLERATEGVQAFGEELRDHRLPVLSARVDALVARLHEDLAATAGLVERLAQREPLRIGLDPATEERLPAAIAAASRRFMDSFRGTREEILARVGEYLPLLGGAGPVLDVGCGRGELLQRLREAGVDARGVDSDPAMVAACRRLGLDVAEGEALDTLRGAAKGELGAVAAVHVLEHLPAAHWTALVVAAAEALRPGGVLLVECPNPESLRVGADLFWIDPTHRAPVHPEALEFVARAAGLEIAERRRLHPFPPEQALADPVLPAPVGALARRLDDWLSAPRDFLLVARKPATDKA
ncbi:MAG TPA: methyltransferase domain-containing protein [Thermoanaerobaculaceae bacterium]|nr:methyltransferase domain-containing protein [Thermoanaerobaculaceae bacterium]